MIQISIIYIISRILSNTKIFKKKSEFSQILKYLMKLCSNDTNFHYFHYIQNSLKY